MGYRIVNSHFRYHTNKILDNKLDRVLEQNKNIDSNSPSLVKRNAGLYLSDFHWGRGQSFDWL